MGCRTLKLTKLIVLPVIFTVIAAMFWLFFSQWVSSSDLLPPDVQSTTHSVQVQASLNHVQVTVGSVIACLIGGAITITINALALLLLQSTARRKPQTVVFVFLLSGCLKLIIAAGALVLSAEYLKQPLLPLLSGFLIAYIGIWLRSAMWRSGLTGDTSSSLHPSAQSSLTPTGNSQP